MDRPKIIGELEMNTDGLVAGCQEYMDAVEKCRETGHDVDEDIAHYIFEAAMETVYGKDVWKYING